MVRIDLPRDRVVEFCRKWRVVEFSLFGSVLSEEFRPDSDVDVLVSFAPGTPWSLKEWVEMIEELEGVFGRPVDLVEKESLVNPFRRHHILNHREIIYAA